MRAPNPIDRRCLEFGYAILADAGLHDWTITWALGEEEGWWDHEAKEILIHWMPTQPDYAEMAILAAGAIASVLSGTGPNRMIEGEHIYATAGILKRILATYFRPADIGPVKFEPADADGDMISHEFPALDDDGSPDPPGDYP